MSGMLAIIEISHQASSITQKLEREDWNLLSREIPNLNLPDWPEDKTVPPSWYAYSRELMIDMVTDAPLLARYGMEFTVKRFKGAYFADATIGSHQTFIPHSQPAQQVTNLQVAIPDMALLMIDEVVLLNDSCTDELQRQLDEGWRIIAICPPNSQRRPDYILGRNKARGGR